MIYRSRIRSASLFLVSSAVMALSGCAAERHAGSMIKRASDKALAALETPPKVEPVRGNPDISHVDELYFGQNVFRRRHGDAFPARLDNLVIRSKGEVDLRGFAALISQATQIPINLGVKPVVQQQQQQQAAPTALGPTGATPAIIDTEPRNSNPANRPVGPTFQVVWQGPLAGLLDMAAARFGVAWDYRAGVIMMSDMQTRTFVINKAPTTDNFSNELSTTTGGSGGGSGGGGGSSSGSSSGQTITPTSNQASSQKASVDVWNGLKSEVDVIVGDRGRFSVNPATGTITVSASPAILDQVATYVREQNELITRQVFVRIKVYSVDLQEGDNLALNFNAKFASAASGLGLALQSPGTAPLTPVGSLTASVLSTTSKLAGSDVIGKAISSVTNTSLITDMTVTSLNNQPITKQDTTTQSYLSSVATTVNQTTATTALTPSSISTGFSMTLLPRVLSGNRVQMSYSISISSLVVMNTATSGGNTIQLPTVAGTAGLQSSMLKSGQVLMLMGYIAESAADAKQGTGIPANLLLGGTRNASTEKKRIIITMEPIIVSEPAT